MRSPIVFASLATVSMAVAWGCATVEDRLGYQSSNAPPASFATEEAGADDGMVLDAGLCVSRDCPSPYTTCPGVPGTCTVNLETDPNNCGACGNACIPPDGGNVPNAAAYCINGKCQLECDVDYGDCNGQLEDGCETPTPRDSQHCGSCGNACQEGEVCWQRACGCPLGYSQCGEQACHRLAFDAKHCGACGNECPFPDDAGPGAALWPCGVGVAPPNWGARCTDSTCDLGCSGSYRDCNGDMCGDGCEIDTSKDPKNCGGCGIECGPEQACVEGICQCQDPRRVYCESVWYTGCVDTDSNSWHCGACGNGCPGYSNPSYDRFGGTPTCELGRCGYYCSPGRADCDEDIDNGCEVDTMTDPMNCGGCGVQCDIAAGQPCAGGKCMTKPCDGTDSGVVF